MPLQSLLEQWSKDAYECITNHQPDYEMYNSEPRRIDCSTSHGFIMPRSKSTEPTGKLKNVTLYFLFPLIFLLILNYG